MASYYVNKNSQANGDHEVHRTGCSFMPNAENRQYLGEFTNCRDAVKKAKTFTLKLMDAIIAQGNVIQIKFNFKH